MMCNDAFQVKLKGDENYRKISISWGLFYV